MPYAANARAFEAQLLGLAPVCTASARFASARAALHVPINFIGGAQALGQYRHMPTAPPCCVCSASLEQGCLQRRPLCCVPG